MPKKKEYNRNSPLLSVVLNTLARDFVGDGRGINVYFVSDEHGDVDTITYDRATAELRFNSLAARYPLKECTLEDRHHGVLASVEPESEEKGARLRVYR
jgi:hypothetical protein